MRLLFLGLLGLLGPALSHAADDCAPRDAAAGFSLTLCPGTLAGRADSAGNILQLNGAAGDTVIQLQYGSTEARGPASVVIPAGSSNGLFRIQTLPVQVVTDIPITATYPGGTATATLRLEPLGVASLRLGPIAGGKSPGMVVLNGPAPMNLAVSLHSSAPGVTLPSSIEIPMGASFARFEVLTGGAQAAVVTASYAESSVTTVLGAPPVLTRAANAASAALGIAPGSLVGIEGAHLTGGATVIARTPWPTQLAGVQVQVNHSPAPLLFMSDSRVTLQMPETLSPGVADIVLVNPAGASAALSVTLVPSAPAILAARPAGNGKLLVYGGGFGSTSAQATLGGKAAVLSAPVSGPFPGIVVLTAQIPVGLESGEQPLILSAGGQVSNTFMVRIP